MYRSELEDSVYIWNPWHGCNKISSGCLNCYMFSTDYSRNVDPTFIHKTGNFWLPIIKDKYGLYKIPSVSLIRTNLTSDTFIDNAYDWMEEFWSIICERKDCVFSIITKRSYNIEKFIPSDWDNIHNVEIMITCENQEMIDLRFNHVKDLPIEHLSLCVAPILENIDITKWLSYFNLDFVSVSGERDNYARVCDFEWVYNISKQCKEYEVNFNFFETGTNFVYSGRKYRIRTKKLQEEQAVKSGLNCIYKDVFYEV